MLFHIHGMLFYTVLSGSHVGWPSRPGLENLRETHWSLPWNCGINSPSQLYHGICFFLWTKPPYTNTFWSFSCNMFASTQWSEHSFAAPLLYKRNTSFFGVHNWVMNRFVHLRIASSFCEVFWRGRHGSLCSGRRCEVAGFKVFRIIRDHCSPPKYEQNSKRLVVFSRIHHGNRVNCARVPCLLVQNAPWQVTKTFGETPWQMIPQFYVFTTILSYHISYIMCHMSYVSCVIRHRSYVICHMILYDMTWSKEV